MQFHLPWFNGSVIMIFFLFYSKMLYIINGINGIFFKKNFPQDFNMEEEG